MLLPEISPIKYGKTPDLDRYRLKSTKFNPSIDGVLIVYTWKRAIALLLTETVELKATFMKKHMNTSKISIPGRQTRTI